MSVSGCKRMQKLMLGLSVLKRTGTPCFTSAIKTWVSQWSLVRCCSALNEGSASQQTCKERKCCLKRCNMNSCTGRLNTYATAMLCGVLEPTLKFLWSHQPCSLQAPRAASTQINLDRPWYHLYGQTGRATPAVYQNTKSLLTSAIFPFSKIFPKNVSGVRSVEISRNSRAAPILARNQSKTVKNG